MSKSKVNELVQQILRHRELYYRGEPVISDYEYDLLEDELKTVSPQHPILQLVGARVDGKKVAHESKMLSLEKTYLQSELVKWAKGERLLAQLKIDGTSCSLIYKKGKLVQAKTRGDGSFGEDVTDKALYIGSVPKLLKNEIDCEVRGEIYCSSQGFQDLLMAMEEAELALPSAQRNIVAGLLGRKNHFYLCRYLDFFAFDLIGKLGLKWEREKISRLKQEGFFITENFECESEAEIEKVIAVAQKFMMSGDYLIDGLVFSLDDLRLHEQRGATAHHPRYRIAYKFKGESRVTKIEQIEWNVSRNGVCTPVARVAPVELSQAMVSRVTLHNMGVVKQYALKSGDEIEIIRSGEVIPKFLKVVKSSKREVKIPESCPSCKQKLMQQAIWLKCMNTKCPAKSSEEILYFVKKIGIENLSHKRLADLIEEGLVSDIKSLYLLSSEQLLALEGYQKRLANVIIESIQKSKRVGLIKFLASLGLEGGGINKCEKIVSSGYPTLKSILAMSEQDLMQVEGFAEKSARAFVNSLASKKVLIEQLMQLGFVVEDFEQKEIEQGQALQGESFCITGALSQKRSEVEKEIKNCGGSIQSGVNSKTNYLVTNEQQSQSSKYKKAMELGVKIITEEQLMSLIKK